MVERAWEMDVMEQTQTFGLVKKYSLAQLRKEMVFATHKRGEPIRML
jgi:hypothetical protein